MKILSTAQYNELVETALNDPNGPLCLLCRRRHRKPKPGEAKRPGWAKQFKGWEWNPRNDTIFRVTKQEFIEVDEEGFLVICNYYEDDRLSYCFETAVSAVFVAEAIAKVRGGWDAWKDGD